MDGMLRGFWYLAVSARSLKPGKTLPLSLLGEAVLLGRRLDGSVFAVSDSCPHRGMPMRHGSFDGQVLRCCYHGWAFRSTDGCCTEIPSLAPEDRTDPSRFRLRTYPAQDVQGNIWVHVGAPGVEPGPVPTVPGFEGEAPQVTRSTSLHGGSSTLAIPPSCTPRAGGRRTRRRGCGSRRSSSSPTAWASACCGTI